MSKSHLAFRLFSIYTYITLLLFIFLGSVSVHLGKTVENKSVSVGQTVQQIIPDWQTIPFTEITVVSASTGCGTGYEAIFTRIWQGISIACDCLGKYDPMSDPSANNNFNQNVKCNSTQTANECVNVQSWPAMYMDILESDSQTDGAIVCGKQGGTPFINVTRPDLNNDCPSGYDKCSLATSAENSVCYPSSQKGANCPITDIQIVATDSVPTYTADEYKSVAFNSTTSFVWSKTSGDQAPITSFSIQKNPCINPYDMSLNSDQTFYPAEMVREDGCTKDKYTGFTEDSRYKKIDFETNVYQMQEDYNVWSILEGSPDSATYLDQTTAEAATINAWIRPTINWKLSCDLDGDTRAIGMQAMATPTVQSTIDTNFFKTMGITLVCIFCVWFVVSLCVHLFVLRTYEPKETAEWMIYVMYVPSRLSFLVWGPWLQAKSSSDWYSLNDNKSSIDKMNIINTCGDAQSKIDLQPIQDEVNEGLKEMDLIYVTIWTCWALALIEFVTWIIYLFYRCMYNIQRNHMMRNHSYCEDDQVKMITVQQQQQQPPVMGYAQGPPQPVQYMQPVAQVGQQKPLVQGYQQTYV